MEGAEYDALKADIAEYGLREPIWLHPDGRIVDGRWWRWKFSRNWKWNPRCCTTKPTSQLSRTKFLAGAETRLRKSLHMTIRLVRR